MKRLYNIISAFNDFLCNLEKNSITNMSFFFSLEIRIRGTNSMKFFFFLINLLINFSIRGDFMNDAGYLQVYVVFVAYV